MLLMLTPGLACAMPSCAHEDGRQISAGKPCHDEAERDQTGHGQKHGPMSNSDCAKIDLQNTDGQIVKKSAAIAQLFTPAISVEKNAGLVLVADTSIIRGPPPDWPAMSLTKPSILMTTLRIRR